MNKARIEKVVNVVIGKPITWLLCLSWLLTRLLAHLARQFLAWLGRRCSNGTQQA